VDTVTDHVTNESSGLTYELYADPAKNKFKKAKTNRTSKELKHCIRGLLINLHS